jgi:hypothetical protein
MTPTEIVAALEKVQSLQHHKINCSWVNSFPRQLCNCGCAEANALIMNIIEAVRGGGWRPIKTAPEDGSDILCARKIRGKWYYEVARYSKDHRKIISDLGTPTHWMPLPPKPPAAGSDDDGK